MNLSKKKNSTLVIVTHAETYVVSLRKRKCEEAMQVSGLRIRFFNVLKPFDVR